MKYFISYYFVVKVPGPPDEEGNAQSEVTSGHANAVRDLQNRISEESLKFIRLDIEREVRAELQKIYKDNNVEVNISIQGWKRIERPWYLRFFE